MAINRIVSSGTTLFQVRRILCAYCKEPYSYLYRHQVASTQSGRAGLGDMFLEQEANAEVIKQCELISKSKQFGHAQCPRCNRLQDWMAKSGFRKHFHDAVVGLGGFVILAIFITFRMDELEGPYYWIAAAVGLLSVFPTSLAYAWIKAPKEKAYGGKASKTDEQLTNALERYAGSPLKLIADWASEMTWKAPSNVTLTFQDYVTPTLFDPELSYEGQRKALQRARRGDGKKDGKKTIKARRRSKERQ